MTDSIDWAAIRDISAWLDEKAAQEYRDQPLAQDWARVAKISEELGEALKEASDCLTAADMKRLAAINISLGKAVQELISFTGQNPRKPVRAEAYGKMLDELADTALTAILAIQHFTRDQHRTREILTARLGRTRKRMIAVVAAGCHCTWSEPHDADCPNYAAPAGE
jgi:hypothetical protein